MLRFYHLSHPILFIVEALSLELLVGLMDLSIYSVNPIFGCGLNEKIFG